MSWRDDLRRVRHSDGRELVGASFRGVPFFVERSERSGGRRTVTHEFPQRDTPYIEDLGRSARTFRITGYVVGDGYLAQRDQLLAALEDAPGSGELVHPYFGAVSASCKSYRVLETTRDGGMAVLEIEFVEAPDQSLSVAESPDLAALVDAAADDAIDFAIIELDELLDLDDAPGFAVESLETEYGNRATKLGDALSGVISDTQELARTKQSTEILVAEAASRVRDPAEAIGGFVDVVAALVETAAGSPRQVLLALLDAYDLDAVPTVPALSATRVVEQANQAAMLAALRQTLAIEAARLIPSVTYETIGDAVADRGRVTNAIEEQELDAGDIAYPGLVALRAAVLRAVPGDAILRRLVTIEQRVTTSSLALAYRLYGDVELEDDIIARNAVQNPCFVSGDLTVLTDGD